MTKRYHKNGISVEELEKLRRKGKGGYFRHRGLAVPLPRNDAEFEVVSEYVFGKKLHLSGLNVNGREKREGNKIGNGSYRVTEIYDSYADYAFESKVGLGQYNLNRVFLDTVFGELGTGGIALHAYGSFDIRGYRNLKRLKAWENSRQKDSKLGSGLSGLRSQFVRLAAQIRERRQQSDSR